MGSNMRYAAIAVAVVVIAICVYVYTRASGAGEKANFTLRIQAETHEQTQRLALRFVNDGPGKLTIATGELQTALVGPKDGRDVYTLYMGRTQEQSDGGYRVVFSTVDMKPVELRAKEEVRINDISPLLSGLPAGKINLVAVYEVSKSIGDRYGVWSGVVESNPFELTVTRAEQK